MTAETMTWLNEMTLIGFTSKRGNAWHYRAGQQGAESNHYAEAIPTADVERRLFHWTPVVGDLVTNVITETGVDTYTDPDRKTIIRPRGTFGDADLGAVLGIFKQGYRVHGFQQWLIKNVETLLDGGLQIGSAGLLRQGAIAWVQIELPDTMEVAGMKFRPHLTAATSLDGTLATTYQTGVQVVVCDNTLSAALGEHDALRVKVRHSEGSLGRIADVREALNLVYAVADDFQAQVEDLTRVEVNDRAWARFLEAHAPTTEKGQAKTGRALTIARNEQQALSQLWATDERVTPWTGTAWGVVQAVNTYEHHGKGARGASKADRNQLRAVQGKVDAMDRGTLATLRGVLAAS
jgi:phage/plasmid-like protein (TIGR03299 family)